MSEIYHQLWAMVTWQWTRGPMLKEKFKWLVLCLEICSATFKSDMFIDFSIETEWNLHEKFLILICQLSILLSNYKKGYDLMCFSLCAKMRLGIADRVRNDKSKFIKDDNNLVLPGSQKENSNISFQIIVWKHKTTLVGIKTRNNYNLSLILFPRKKARKLTIHLLSLLKGSLKKKMTKQIVSSELY